MTYLGTATARAHQRAAVGTLTPDFLRSLLPPTLTVEAVERERQWAAQRVLYLASYTPMDPAALAHHEAETALATAMLALLVQMAAGEVAA